MKYITREFKMGTHALELGGQLQRKSGNCLAKVSRVHNSAASSSSPLFRVASNSAYFFLLRIFARALSRTFRVLG